MISNDERREVAARLREQRVWDIFTNFENCIGDLCDAVFDDEGDLNDMFRLQKALADLIDRPTATATMDYEAMEDGIPDCRIWTCNGCKESFPVYRGFCPTYCPVCGMEIKK